MYGTEQADGATRSVSRLLRHYYGRSADLSAYAAPTPCPVLPYGPSLPPYTAPTPCPVLT
eukprot:2872372-Rhodomonas_salina.2